MNEQKSFNFYNFFLEGQNNPYAFLNLRYLYKEFLTINFFRDLGAKMESVNRKLAKPTIHVKHWGIKSLLTFDSFHKYIIWGIFKMRSKRKIDIIQQKEFLYRHSSISAVSISAVFDLLRFIILSYFPPL